MECAQSDHWQQHLLLSLAGGWRLSFSLRLRFCLIYSTRSANFKLCLLKGDHYYQEEKFELIVHGAVRFLRPRLLLLHMVYGYELTIYLCGVNEDRRAQYTLSYFDMFFFTIIFRGCVCGVRARASPSISLSTRVSRCATLLTVSSPSLLNARQ